MSNTDGFENIMKRKMIVGVISSLLFSFVLGIMLPIYVFQETKVNIMLNMMKMGRLMAQGLLTATIGTKIGGDLNYIARELVSEFIRPVFSGDKITCEVTIKNVEQMEGFKR